ncbi:hypothetical protein GA0070618_5294 [Micromonospora echinospora]|uniref:Uncharacterized protein n=1 Tax=Micromonospora echinospora TaxID=1877 RepID=A0A1C4ZI44_MICEC|nr:hypothetical protein Misp04_38980 [Micromonospora sp. NBRC 101691]SCF32707.1 hypothetical protein GA0070618_5294 [Micromonospora echinospora]
MALKKTKIRPQTSMHALILPPPNRIAAGGKRSTPKDSPS